MANKSDKVMARAIYGTTAAVLKMIEHGRSVEQIKESVSIIQSQVAKEAINSPQDRQALEFGLELAMQSDWKHFI